MTSEPRAEERAIVVELDLPSAPEKVWRALTEPELLSAWLMPNDIRAEVGHRFTFRTQPAPGFDGIVHCEVLEATHPVRLRYSWRGGPLDTVVTWTLTPTPSGTHLRLEHAGFGPEHGATYAMLEQGWREKAATGLARAVAQLA